VYGLVLCATVALASLWGAARRRLAGTAASRRLAWILPGATLAWAVAAGVPARPLAPRMPPDVHEAGTWARANLPANCVDYLVKDWLAAYWLHVATLGNARASVRMADEPYNYRRTVGRWIEPGSLRYAIAGDLEQVPKDARGGMRVLQRFGRAAVAERADGQGACSDPTPPIDALAPPRR
jgi:hypothetical protein